MEAQALLHLGEGFFQGLRLHRNISIHLHERLRARLSEWLDTSSLHREMLKKIFDPSFSSEETLILRQRAELVQMLKRRNFPDWLAIREAFFQPDHAGEQERLRWMEEVLQFLEPTECETLSLLGRGVVLSKHRET